MQITEYKESQPEGSEMKTKLSNEFITRMVYCRNCNERQAETREICTRCEKPLVYPMKQKVNLMIEQYWPNKGD